MPGCGVELAMDSKSGTPVNVGEVAHIAGEHAGKGGSSRKSARYDPTMTEADRNHYDNLIYLCANCHTIIDAIPVGERDFPTSRLREIKVAHEQERRNAIMDAIATVGFPELEEATRWVMNAPPRDEAVDFSLLAPEEKLRRNSLSDGSRAIITMGLGVSREVGHYIQTVTQTEPDFPDRLKYGLLQEYARLRKEGHAGDDLFDLMVGFVQRGFTDQARKAGGIAVLTYMFEACEIFER